jgi:hypothetical protein
MLRPRQTRRLHALMYSPALLCTLSASYARRPTTTMFQRGRLLLRGEKAWASTTPGEFKRACAPLPLWRINKTRMRVAKPTFHRRPLLSDRRGSKDCPGGAHYSRSDCPSPWQVQRSSSIEKAGHPMSKSVRVPSARRNFQGPVELAGVLILSMQEKCPRDELPLARAKRHG